MGKPLLTDEMIERANRDHLFKMMRKPKSCLLHHSILVIHVLETTVLVKIHSQSK